MPTPLKIDPVELNRLLGERRSTKEIANHFNCSPGAVSQAKRRLGVAVVKVAAERKKNPDRLTSVNANDKKVLDASNKAAPIIINTADDAKFQLSTLVTRCNDELRWIQNSVEQKSDSTYKGWQEIALKHVAEIRKLVSALADIEYKLHHVDIVEKALLIMFEEIGHESKECQKRIRDRLERASILFCMDN